MNERDRQAIRRELRARRRKLPRSERREAQRAIVRNLQRISAYRRARNLAVYLGVDGEVDLGTIVEHARSSGKAVFVPVLAQNGLRFVETDPCRTLLRNRFGIPEPMDGRRIDPRALDVVLAPLVAFDAHGNRLGMGKGYYDRSFRFLKSRRCWCKPKLIGIGFDFQRIELLRPQQWDVPLWGAVTSTRVDYF